MPDGTTMRWGVAGAALSVALFAWAIWGWLRGRGVRPLRGIGGFLTRRMQFASQSCETTAEGEFAPGEASPSSVATNVSIRGGGTVEWRGRSGKWSCRRSFSEYGADGCRTDYDVSESSDGGTVTNSATSYDFLGRVARRATPLSQTAYEYGGPSPRVLSTLDEASGVAVTNLYDEAGEPVGAVSGGVEEMRRTGYEFISNAWWRVERSAQIAGGVTNSPSATYTRLTGLSDALRSEVVECRDGAEVRRTVVAYDPVEGTERETVFDAASGESWTVGMFGYPVEAGTPTHVVTNFYGPVGKVFVRQLSVPGETSRRVEEIEVDALGDETCRVVCDRYWLDEAPYSEFVYDCRGNRCVVTNAVGAATFAAHDPDGNVVAEGGATYPTEADYDASGRRVALRTTRDGEAWDETSWAYDAATGVCTNKTYADGSTVSYTHTTDGLPLRTTYASGRWKENAYDSRRQLAQVSHSDSSLDYSIARDAFGRATNVTDAAGNEWRYEYDAFGDVLREEAITAGRDDPIAPNIAAAVTRTFDSVGRQTGFALSVCGTPKGGVGYEYGDGGLLSMVSNADATVSYSYTPDRHAAGYEISFAAGGTFTRTLNHDFYRRDLVVSISNGCGEASQTMNYSYDELSRPVSRNGDTFGYNDRSEVVEATIADNAEEHEYDSIGNTTLAAFNNITNSYTANSLNQYTSILRGSATLREISHDADGNMTSDGVFAYAYDAENRLASVSSNGITLVANQYDYKGRRIKKTTQTTETTFVYDGWNLVYEREVAGGVTNETFYCWGKDLSGTLQGAGGVGGLLYLKRNGAIYVPHADANGNIVRYTDTTGNVVAEYTYDAFGSTIAQSGPMADIFRIRFSCKYFDPETGLYYYGYRFYSPTLMRWLNRDPIEEDGGLNLYGFCGNHPTDGFDSLGKNRYITQFDILNMGGSGGTQLHVGVAVDRWECVNGKWKRIGSSTFDFRPAQSFLNSVRAIFWVARGVITERRGNHLVAPIKLTSTPVQDIKMLNMIREEMKHPPFYNVVFLNCVFWSVGAVNYGL